MKININHIIITLFLFLLGTNVLVTHKLYISFLEPALALISLSIIPGLLLMLILKITKIDPWEYLVYSIGLSLTFLMTLGFILNWTLPVLNITNKPLSLYPILIGLDIVLVFLSLVAYLRNKELEIKLTITKLKKLELFFLLVAVVFPLLSILGATKLNNNGNNYITMFMLGGIAIYVLFLSILRNKLTPFAYPLAIISISTSLLLMYSMRSWHILGFDINQEYQVFQLTSNNSYWDIPVIKNAYNACLSITILPTIYNLFLKINNEYIFKLIFTLFFSLTPLAVYLFLKRYSSIIISFMASFFFMSQYQFMEQMTALVRQEIALLFFTLSLLSLFSKELNPIYRKLFFLIFGFSMIVSHYSTSYVALSLFLFTYLIFLIFRKINSINIFSSFLIKLNLKNNIKTSFENKYYINGKLVFLLIIFSFLWYSQITNISGSLVTVISDSFKNMGSLLSEDMNSEQVNLSLFGGNDNISLKDLQKYISSTTNKYHKKYKYLNYYSSESFKNYTPLIINSQNIPTTNIFAVNLIYYITEFAQKSIKVFIIIGIFYLIFFKFKENAIDREYIIMVLGSLFLVGLILFVPSISVAYNFDRLYEQVLVILSLPAITGAIILFKVIKNENLKVLLICLILVCYFIPYSGFSSQFFGGQPATQLNNFGDDYNKFYTHDSDIKALLFLSKTHKQSNNLIYMDRYSTLKAYAYINIDSRYISSDIIPSTIDKNAYVYASYTNIILNTTFAEYNNREIDYNFPKSFLNTNKNLIYNNGNSEVFK